MPNLSLSSNWERRGSTNFYVTLATVTASKLDLGTYEIDCIPEGPIFEKYKNFYTNPNSKFTVNLEARNYGNFTEIVLYVNFIEESELSKQQSEQVKESLVCKQLFTANNDNIDDQEKLQKYITLLEKNNCKITYISY